MQFFVINLKIKDINFNNENIINHKKKKAVRIIIFIYFFCSKAQYKNFNC